MHAIVTCLGMLSELLAGDVNEGAKRGATFLREQVKALACEAKIFHVEPVPCTKNLYQELKF